MSNSTLRKQGWNFAYLPSAVFLSPDLTHFDVRLFAYLLWRQGGNDRAWPNVKTMAADLGASEQLVRLSLRHLIEQNWIRRSRNYGKSSDTYVFESQELCKEFDARSANLLEDDPLTCWRMIRQPVSRLNENQLTRIKELANGKTAVRVSNAERRAFEEKFLALTGLSAPENDTPARKRSNGSRWWSPIRTMIVQAGSEEEWSTVLELTIRRMRSGPKPLTISCPQSIEKTFLAILGERRVSAIDPDEEMARQRADAIRRERGT